jgi:hypothetical protein
VPKLSITVDICVHWPCPDRLGSNEIIRVANRACRPGRLTRWNAADAPSPGAGTVDIGLYRNVRPMRGSLDGGVACAGSDTDVGMRMQASRW